MPPRRRRSGQAQAAAATGGNEYATAFGRAHPIVMRGLVTVCQCSGPLLIGTILWTAGFLQRPMWERVTMWRAYLWTFISRWVLVGCAITWTLNGWDQQQQQNGNPAQQQQDGVDQD
ncbi:uncharacterized protein PV06_02960 [Exophiala oligosperma]|uniref:Uncharacterized protein n=2 Tax=Chaetothyriales TaxID=34395 RepID=A0A0D2AXI5_9EURO|nr:uncharacterized protein PV06_02960 [Exophiala oligosperma]KAJ9625420.1 hypothetical protein H2204_010393 [Knufia peltigerae]KIW44496.1 hypothetical protein PV06_02960 [Exophiala oligosperma]